MEVVTAYQWNDRWYTGAGIEVVVKGNREYETSAVLGYSLRTQTMGTFQFEGRVVCNFNRAAAASVNIDWVSKCERWQIGVMYAVHNVRTLVGERNIPFLKQGPMSYGRDSFLNHEVNIFVGVSL